MIRFNWIEKSMAIYNSAVCNCHKDDEFTPLFDLVNSGYLFINKTNSVSERLNFGIRLRKALSSFTKRFVPHMKEEEEVTSFRLALTSRRQTRFSLIIFYFARYFNRYCWSILRARSWPKWKRSLSSCTCSSENFPHSWRVVTVYRRP